MLPRFPRYSGRVCDAATNIVAALATAAAAANHESIAAINNNGVREPRLDRTCELHTFSSKNGFNLGCCRSKSILAKFSSRAKRIDVISRFIFPLLFAIFNLAYWMYYLLAKGSNESYKD